LTRSGIVNAVKIAIAVGLIYWVLEQAGGWDKVRDTLADIQMDGWVLGMLAITASTCLSILRWYLLMRSVGLVTTSWTVFKLGWIGVFFNNVVPGLTGGDLIKAFYVTRDHPNQRTDAVISVIVDRVIGIVALAFIAAVIIPFDIERYGEVAAGIYGFLGATALGSVVVLSRRVKARLRRLLGRQGEGDGSSLLAKIDRAVSMYRNRLGTIAVAMGMSIVVHLLLIVGMRFFGEALAAGALQADGQLAAETLGHMETLHTLGLDVYCSIIPIIFMISSLPIAPAGWGVGEAAFQYFFQQVGVGAAAAVALSLTYRLTAMLISLLGGVFLALDRKRVVEQAGRPPVP
jgi:hypothetical protein